MNYESVPLGSHIIRTKGKRKGWRLQRIVQPDHESYPGPWFWCEETDEDFNDWDLPDDDHWQLLS